ncbi:hypothetical protein QNH46_07930 [Paenibacillus woosongensis]|uniref:Uncharacterized protein n=1 Tax=Paenibacillus woosongensis TaxID=307580 RepID=A0AA95I4U3_9BACL|nr:hypothetical protein [Paenibacillus woosongensis]WHX50564.1 hypothetical protein QNH46_07930 [Paenibacillus woosongensis]
MAQIQNVLRVELDPNNPVPEACQVIQAIISMYTIAERAAIIEAIQDELGVAVKQLKGVEAHGEPVRRNNRK